jgi:uncharacterized SAM-binding protein YcdF (DUF218 family)
MFFYASKIIAPLFWPSSIVLLLLVAGTVLLLSGRGIRWGRRMVVSGVMLMLICGFSPLGNWLSLPLEQRFERGAVPEDLAGIIILGGFESIALTRDREQLAINEAAERLTEGILLAKARPRAKVIFTGGDAAMNRPEKGGAADQVRQYLLAIGIAPERLVIEGASRTTHENALFLVPLLKPAPGRRYLLVTSAYHMPRSIATFRAKGFDVEPWPVDYRTTGWQDLTQPSTSMPGGLMAVDTAFKEWVGLVAYRLSGRSSELWPGPAVPRSP